MKYRLPAIWARIRDETIASLCNAFFLSEFARNHEEMPYKLFIFRFERADGLNVFVRYDQDVSRRDRMGISKGRDLVITIKKGRLGFLGNDLAENT
jgi:hypothetical protein